MDRVQASEAWGRGFESHAARQFMQKGAKRSLFFRLALFPPLLNYIQVMAMAKDFLKIGSLPHFLDALSAFGELHGPLRTEDTFRTTILFGIHPCDLAGIA